MDDAFLVRRVERVGDLARDRERLGDRQIGPRCDAIGERLALDQLQHECRAAVDVFEAVDRARCADG